MGWVRRWADGSTDCQIHRQIENIRDLEPDHFVAVYLTDLPFLFLPVMEIAAAAAIEGVELVVIVHGIAAAVSDSFI